MPRTLDQWLAMLEARHPVAIDLGLDRVGEVWRRLGQPRPAKRLVVVGGTNGKGSTVAYLCAMLQALGLSQGGYTSPHLFRYNERVRIDGRTLPDEAWVAAFEQVEQARGATSLTYFEFGTLAAFLLLAEAGLDYAVLEVGLGGRLDAVNLLDADCAVITTIGLDHQEYLGDDRESIAREKAGIMRPGRPVICTEPDPPATLVERAVELGAPLLRLGRAFDLADTADGCAWSMNGHTIRLPVPPLLGPHQRRNLAGAVAALAVLLPARLAEWGAEPAALAEGIRAVRLPGRMEPAQKDGRVLIDVGHNPHAATAIADALAETLAEALAEPLAEPPAEPLAGTAGRLHCVLGMLRDKDARAVGLALQARVDEWYCAGLGGERGRSGEQLAATIAEVAGAGRVQSFARVSTALDAALHAADPADRILVFGSFVTAAEAHAFLNGP